MWRIGPPRVPPNVWRSIGSFAGTAPRSEVVRARVQLLVVEELERRALERVRAGLGDDRNRHARGHPLFGIHAAGRDVDGLDRLGRGDIHVVVRQPDVHVPRAVGERRVGRAVLAVHGHVQRTLRRVGFGILEGRRERAGHEHDQRLIVSEPVQRKIRDLGGLQLGVDVRLVGLQQLGRRLDGDGLGQGADRQRQVHAADLADRDGHARSDRFLEPLQRDLDVVRAGRDVDEGVRALRVGGRLPREVGVGVDDRHPGPRHDRALRVDDCADDAAIKNLSLRTHRHGDKYRQPDGDQAATQSRQSCPRSHSSPPAVSARHSRPAGPLPKNYMIDTDGIGRSLLGTAQPCQELRPDAGVL